MLQTVLDPDDLESRTPISAEEALETYYMSKFCVQTPDEFRRMYDKMNKTQRTFYSVEKQVIEDVLFDLCHSNNGLDLDDALTIEEQMLQDMKHSEASSEMARDCAQFGITAMKHFRRRLCI